MSNSKYKRKQIQQVINSMERMILKHSRSKSKEMSDKTKEHLKGSGLLPNIKYKLPRRTFVPEELGRQVGLGFMFTLIMLCILSLMGLL